MKLPDREIIRLLFLAKDFNGDHKSNYSKYCELMKDDLVGWQLGTAYITQKGEDFLDDYFDRRIDSVLSNEHK